MENWPLWQRRAEDIRKASYEAGGRFPQVPGWILPGILWLFALRDCCNRFSNTVTRHGCVGRSNRSFDINETIKGSLAADVAFPPLLKEVHALSERYSVNMSVRLEVRCQPIRFVAEFT